MWVAWIGWRAKPHGVRGWQPSAVIAVLVVTPLIAMLQLVPEVRSPADVAAAAGVVVYPMIGLAAILLYVHWRITKARGSSCLTAVLTVTAVNGLTFEVVRLTAPEQVWERPAWMLIADITLTAGLLLLVRVAERRAIPIDPMAGGLVIGLGITEINLVVGRTAPSLHPSDLALAVGELLLLAIGLAIAWAILRLTSLPRWATTRLALAVTVLCIGRAVSGHDVPQSALQVAVPLATSIIGTVLLCDAALALVRQAIRREQRVLRAMQRQIAAMEGDGRADRATLHEIKGSIAGIASACRLIRHAEDLAMPRRIRLQEMLEMETSRLERLVAKVGAEARQADEPWAQVDLDTTIGPVVTSHLARGHLVHWQPSGQTVQGRRDDIAEVINILLDNAAKHAPTAAAGIDIRRQDGTIEIAVSDDGPGVSPSVGKKLFEWGARGPQSSGQGIGLHVAHRLMHDRGTYLRLEDSVGRGARFVVGLPAAGERR
jgi:signal transduction histidine kinase